MQFRSRISDCCEFCTLLQGIAGYLANGGCGCGCGYGEEGCIYAPLSVNGSTSWQSVETLSQDDIGYADALSCGTPEVYDRLLLADDVRCRPFEPSSGSFWDSCEALSSPERPCAASATDTLGFTGDSSYFGEKFFAHTDEGTGPESFCTYQPDHVRYLPLQPAPIACITLSAGSIFDHHFTDCISWTLRVNGSISSLSISSPA